MPLDIIDIFLEGCQHFIQALQMASVRWHSIVGNSFGDHPECRFAAFPPETFCALSCILERRVEEMFFSISGRPLSFELICRTVERKRWQISAPVKVKIVERKAMLLKSNASLLNPLGA